MFHLVETNDDNFNLIGPNYPISQCPICRGFYHYKQQKFRSQPSFWDSLPPLQHKSNDCGAISYFASIGPSLYPLSTSI